MSRINFRLLALTVGVLACTASAAQAAAPIGAYTTQGAIVLWGAGDGTFPQQTALALPLVNGSGGSGQTGITAGRVDNDALPDLIVGEYGPSPSVLFGQPNRKQRKARARLTLESLEERLAPAVNTDTWTGLGGRATWSSCPRS